MARTKRTLNVGLQNTVPLKPAWMGTSNLVNKQELEENELTQGRADSNLTGQKNKDTKTNRVIVAADISLVLQFGTCMTRKETKGYNRLLLRQNSMKNPRHYTLLLRQSLTTKPSTRETSLNTMPSIISAQLFTNPTSLSHSTAVPPTRNWS